MARSGSAAVRKLLSNPLSRAQQPFYPMVAPPTIGLFCNKFWPPI
jgi:hypothetical protein